MFSQERVKGEGPVVEEELTLATFDKLSLPSSIDVYLRPGDEQKVVAKGQANIIALLDRDIDGGRWTLRTNKSWSTNREFSVYITVPRLESIRLSGSGDLQGDGLFTGIDVMDITVSGSGDIAYAFEAQRCEITVTGSGDLNLEGQAERMDIRVSGSGDINAGKFRVGDADIRITGSGDVSLHVDNNLEASISGSGAVYYRGQPRVKSRSSGSGDVQSID